MLLKLKLMINRILFCVKKNWSNIYQSNSVNTYFSAFQNIIRNTKFESSTTKYANLKNRKLKKRMSKGLLCSTCSKHNFSPKCKNIQVSNYIASYHKKFKNNFIQLSRLAKIIFIRTIFQCVFLS